MHRITGDREKVMQVLKGTMDILQRDHAKTRRAGVARMALKSDSEWSQNRDEMVNALNRAYKRTKDAKVVKQAKAIVQRGRAAALRSEGIGEEEWFAPHDRTIALIQSAMDEYLDKQAAKTQRAARVRGAAPVAREAVIGEQFDTIDLGWAEVAIEKLKLLFKKNHKFITHKKVTDFRFDLPDKATIALVGDWGGGNSYAQEVAERIKALQKKNDNLPNYVIHLGDVYYAGTEKEVNDRFLKFWPAPKSPGRSFALNSNHEMYGGGYAYFDVTLKKFGQPASYFNLRNKNFRFIGLDTGYVDHNLNKEQVDWLTAQFDEGQAKTFLLTHHQLFSAYEDATDELANWTAPLRDAGKITGWFWGHEHLCVVYEPFMNIKGRCVGNGCFPYEAPEKAKHTEVPVKFLNTRKQEGHLSHGMHTFVWITLDGPKMSVEYIDQDGTVAFKEDFKV